MKRRGTQGAIININSVNGANYLQANRVGYCASKAAVMQMTKALVRELSPHGMLVNCIVPGPFHTAATDYKVSTPELKENLKASIPLGFFAEPSDLDGLVLYLASNHASKYVTGASFTIDGGMSWGGKSW